MDLTWRTAYVDLVDKYWIQDAEGRQINSVPQARVAIDGAFVHIEVPGTDAVQVVSAPAIYRMIYRAA